MAAQLHAFLTSRPSKIKRATFFALFLFIFTVAYFHNESSDRTIVQYVLTPKGRKAYEWPLEDGIIVPKTGPSRRHYFTTWRSREDKIPIKLDLTLGTFFYHHPEESFHIWSNTLSNNSIASYRELGYDLHIQQYDFPTLARLCDVSGSLAAWAVNGTFLAPGAPHYNTHESDFLKVCINYIYGGLYVDGDTFFLDSFTPDDIPAAIFFISADEKRGDRCPPAPDPVTCSAPHVRQIEEGGRPYLVPNSVWFNSNPFVLPPKSPYAHAVLSNMEAFTDPHCWNCIGPRSHSKGYADLVAKGDALLLPPLLRSCDNLAAEHIPWVAKGRWEETWGLFSACRWIHMFSAGRPMDINENSVFVSLMQTNCVPEICLKYMPKTLRSG
ncbi:uncharacterized protein SPPG_07429 [Spizellomyces punctatus DAOM BR117]|uniref:Alpha 1,4-glycosyltransferase domain-containing protein n=1 Tax=Spizellomyces punctatus (strain DAOM BR117) TaxID=645134 RepID=A0A0L0H6A3_SPIPD|nr:uncharacterized protein SPPG_07429 [Spizellomyces punctatus DAOM BR117]KNC97030.1 hypothetical protein SPPG_07429 [Spizellomyces punctatus DAOM BR117]|eukprot:XP_016605070.1 hypothetical protein SPPG_07429 [Spizellomyces punctatus DAOM BR117]